MKKILTCLISLIFLSSMLLPAFADSTDDDLGTVSDDLMKYTNTMENAFNGQKKITDEDFDKTYKQVQERQQKKKKGKKAKPFKGKNYNEETSGQYIDETAQKNLLLCVPAELINGDGTEIPVGHYKIVGEKDKDNVYLDFYQSSTLVAKVPAIETTNDFDKIEINFVQLMPYNEERIKVIYGSMDFNAYTFIKLKNKISDKN